MACINTSVRLLPLLGPLTSNATDFSLVWTALESEGLGVNVQHCNPLIDEAVSEEWNVPREWCLNAQMVFGKPTGQPNEKTFKPLEERYKIYGA